MLVVQPSGNGLVFRGNVIIAIDASRPVRGAHHFLTHAHTDHMGAALKTVSYASEITHYIASLRNAITKPFEYIEIGNISVSLLNAGHIAGSSQILIENGRSILITGDFKYEKDLVAGRADTENVDVLFLETTFSTPFYNFPPRKKLYRKIINLVKHPIIFIAYEVGKTQELTALLNYYGIVPYVTDNAHLINRLLGLNSRIISQKSFREKSVVIVPRRLSGISDIIRKEQGVDYKEVFVSGWNGFLPLSSHADWKQTIDFIEQVSPELVVTYGPNKEVSARYLKKEGFNAVHLKKSMLI